MKYLILTDLHLNPSRKGGTTLESRAALEAWQFARLEEILETPHDRLIINGDIFDKYSVSEKTLLKAYELLKDESVILVRGNHDNNSEKYGSICALELLAEILPNCTLVYAQPYTEGNLHFVPHCVDQAQFNYWLDKVPECDYLFLHCNYDNYFAVEADHSLNLSAEQARNLPAKRIILGHEHNKRIDGKVGMLGCTLCTSISDCLGGAKFAHVLDTEAVEAITVIETFSEDNFLAVDWRDAQVTDHPFVRIIGSCSIVEYAEVVKKVATIRAKSKSFIVANAVTPEVIERADLAAEEVTEFNIIELLLGQIDKEFVEEVKTCL